MSDLIKRQDALDMVRILQTYKLFDGDDMVLIDKTAVQTELMMLPSAEPERLTDDDFEAIRIHLNAYKEKLCNQRRWEEAEEYQRIIDRFVSFASAEPERKRGKWIGYKDDDPQWKRDDGSPIFLICSECHETVLNNGSAHWNFCPNCGAKMEGV